MNQPEIKDALQKGIRAARRGRKEPAQRLLAQVVQAEPENEEAWLWLSRVVDSTTERATCLNRALALNPDNRWAADQLAELEAAMNVAAEATTPAQPPPMSTQSDLEVQVLQCPNCGAPLEIHGDAIKTLVCNNCHSVLDLTAEQAAILNKADPNVTPAVPIDLGMTGKFQGEEHQVIGWLRYEGWDDEDRWQWDEWLLLSAGGAYRWLAYDAEDGFIFYRPIEPTQPFDPRATNHIPVPGGIARVTERAPAKLVALKGELTWRATVGDRIGYLDAKLGDAVYSVEYNEEEIDLLSGRPLSPVKVWTTFGREDLAERARVFARHNEIRWQTVHGWMALFCLILTLLACSAAFWAGNSGRQLFTTDLTLSPTENREKLIGPFEAQEAGRAHRVTVRLREEIPASNWVQVSLGWRDSQNRDFNIVTHQFSGGAEAETSHLFSPIDGGQVHLKVAFADGTIRSVPLTVVLEEGVWLSRYFIMFGVISGGLLLVFAAGWLRTRSRSKGEDEEIHDDTMKG